MRRAKRTELQRIFQTVMAGELEQYRKRNGLTQERMAQKLKLSVRTYADLEHGICAPSAATLAIYLSQLPIADQRRLLETLRDAWEE